MSEEKLFIVVEAPKRTDKSQRSMSKRVMVCFASSKTAAEGKMAEQSQPCADLLAPRAIEVDPRKPVAFYL